MKLGGTSKLITRRALQRCNGGIVREAGAKSHAHAYRRRIAEKEKEKGDILLFPGARALSITAGGNSSLTLTTPHKMFF
jgi:hypothetical protein